MQNITVGVLGGGEDIFVYPILVFNITFSLTRPVGQDDGFGWS